MVLLSNILSAPLALSVLLLQHVVARPQFVTTGDAIYQTDDLGNIVSTVPVSLSVSTDANGDLLSTVPVPLSDSTVPVLASTTTPIPAVPVVTTGPPPAAAGPLGPAPVTTYVYTSIDDSGNQNVVTATFTPTYQPTVYPTSYQPATILAWSDFTSLYGAKTATATGATGAGTQRLAFAGGSAFLWTGAATMAAFLAGARMVAML
ncbi:hypothetical protein FRB97_004952 [Tulasnella sp. 331]|nr:hypothetical protein FRB97_004952 [Tulasnella sp. 331]